MRRLAAVLGSLALSCAPTLNKPELDDRVVDASRHALNREALISIVGDAARLMDIGHRLRKLGVDLCDRQTTRLAGLRTMRKGDSDFDSVLEETYGIDDEPTVVHVVPGSAADEAGVRLRDVALEVDGRRVSSDARLRTQLRRAGEGPIGVRLRRDGQEFEVELDAPVGCDHHALISRSGAIATFLADNRKDYYVTLGTIDFTSSDDELAVVLSHQIAHFLVKRRGFGFVTNEDKIEAEIAADRLGLTLAARAGYDVTVAPAMLERLALEQPWLLDVKFPGGGSGEIHAFAAERLEAMPAALEEIAAEQKPEK